MLLLFFFFGIFSLISQVVILREISFLFLGHEMSLGIALSSWLFWTAAGSFYFSVREAGDKSGVNPGDFCSLCAVAAAMPLSVVLARLLFLALPHGSIPGLFSILCAGVLLTLPAGLLNGIFIGRVMKHAGLGTGFYVYEALGACAGGVVWAFWLAGRVNPLAAVCLCSALLLLYSTAAYSAIRKSFLLLPALAAAIVIYGCWRADAVSRTLPYRGMKIRAEAETPYARLAALEFMGSRIFVENDFISGEYPSPQTSEEAAHLPALAHKSPRKILALGAQGILIISELLKHSPESVEVVDADEGKISLLAGFTETKFPKTAFIHADPREFLEGAEGGYDVILQCVPEPVNAAANRFFTVEFFETARRALKKGGIFSFSVPSAENYLSPEESYFNAGVIATVKKAFPHAALVPGKRLVVLASDSPVGLTAENLSQRYASRKIKNTVFVPSFFPFLLDPGRIKWLDESLLKAGNIPVNSDFYPVSYFYTWRVWLSKFVSPLFLLGIIACVGLLSWGLLKIWRERKLWTERPGLAALFAAGFWGMAVEIILLFAFQSVTGALHWRLGMLFSAFMLGLAAGGLALKRFLAASAQRGTRGRKSLILLLALCALYSALSALLLPLTSALGLGVSTAVFAVLLFAAGFIVGGVFPASVSMDAGKGGELYALDLWGACAGGLISSSFLVPLLGFKITLILAALPCAAAAYLGIKARHLSTA